MPTLQETFDHVVRHLAKQGGPALNRDGACMYRGPNGTKCAIGCVIPEHLYTPDIEHQRVHNILRGDCGKPELRAAILRHGEEMPNLLDALQQAHDNAPCLGRKWNLEENEWSNSIAQRLREVADQFELNTAVVDECFPRGVLG